MWCAIGSSKMKWEKEKVTFSREESGKYLLTCWAGSEESSDLSFVCFVFCLFVVILILVTTASRIRNYFKSSIPTVLLFFRLQTHILYLGSHSLCQANRKQVFVNFRLETRSEVPFPCSRSSVSQHSQEGIRDKSFLGGCRAAELAA